MDVGGVSSLGCKVWSLSSGRCQGAGAQEWGLKSILLPPDHGFAPTKHPATPIPPNASPQFMLWFSLCWILYSYIQLTIYYIGGEGGNGQTATWRVIVSLRRACSGGCSRTLGFRGHWVKGLRQHDRRTFTHTCLPLPQLRTFYWLYLTLMLAVLVAYTFEILCWLILGCVINPNKYLPYSVATITMLGHAQTTYDR